MNPLILPTYYEMFRALPILDKAQFSRLWRVILRMSDPEQRCSPIGQLRMFVYEWLVHLSFLPEDRIRWILTKYADRFAELARDIAACWPGFPPGRPEMLIVVDRRYVRLSSGDWLDTETEQLLTDGTTILVTYISVDLVALFHTKQAMLRKLVKEGKDAQPATSGTNQST